MLVAEGSYSNLIFVVLFVVLFGMVWYWMHSNNRS